MAAITDGQSFVQAPLAEQALWRLRQQFPSTDDAVSRQNVAQAISQQVAQLGGNPGVVGGRVTGGSGSSKQALRAVGAAWQVLEVARLICPDLSQSTGDWFVLTAAGQFVRDSSDAEREVELRLPGGV